MKQIDLNLQKRLLIVECDIEKASILNISGDFLPEYKKDLICKGSELTEEFLSNTDIIQESKMFTLLGDRSRRFKSYTQGNAGFQFRLDSFISAIKALGYYWGENPIKHPEDFDNLPSSLSFYCKQEDKHFEAESKTFNPEKSLIFEIL